MLYFLCLVLDMLECKFELTAQLKIKAETRELIVNKVLLYFVRDFSDVVRHNHIQTFPLAVVVLC